MKVDIGDVFAGLAGCGVIAIAVFVILLTFVALFNNDNAIDVFSTRFDECMATEKFTRDECIVYAKGE